MESAAVRPFLSLIDDAATAGAADAAVARLQPCVWDLRAQ